MLTTIGLEKSGLLPFADFNCIFLAVPRPLYNYRPLESSTHIRVLHLRDGGEGKCLRCKIEHVDFTQRPSYQAISYVWGSSKKPWWIEVDDGSRIPLTSSLRDALRDLRSVCKAGSNVFWADAICINQADITERSKQVKLMGRRYSSATRVITYIGPASPTDYGGLDLAGKPLDYAKSHRGEPGDPRLRVRESQHQVGFPDAQDPQWEALRSLLKREWSTRVWMVQELLLNKELLMICGRHSLPWNTFTQLPRLVVDREIPGDPAEGSMVGTTILDNLSVLDVLRTEREGNPDLNMTMLELLQWCHVMSSTDPRDKVYAVLGLACDSDRLDIIPDYSIDTAQVYQDTTVRILETHQTLDILGSAHSHKTSPNEWLKLPSWVPDWSFWSDDNLVPLVHDVTFSRQRFYDACAGTKSKIKFNAQKSQLTVRGVILDHITFSSGRLDSFTQSPADISYRFWYLYEQLHNWRESLSQLKAEEVFWRTLIANIVYEQREASSEVGEWFSAYMDLLRRNAAIFRGESYIPLSIPTTDLASKFMTAMYAKAGKRSLCTTRKNHLSLAPPDAKVGDYLCVLLGGPVPYILRQGNDGAYMLVGECYVHGLMKGEVFQNQTVGGLVEDIKLV